MRISDWSSDVCSSDLVNVQFSDISPTFKPEYVNAFEVGIKNSFDGGRFTLNATGFYYDYKDYQVSQIVDRIALNENFDATSWGLEFEAAWRPRSEEHTSELQSLMRISYAVFCLKKKNNNKECKKRIT